jgi:formate hydrogenlyase transcriptional activator
VGGGAPIQVDVRVIAATNRDLLKAVGEKAFREDLYYRLSVFPIPLPPLRERSEDVPLLVQFLLDRFATKIGKRVDGVSRETMQRLTAYSWPGNIRELENLLERAVILATGPTLEIGPDILSEPVSATAAGPSLALEEVERNHILNVLGQTGWVIDGPKGAATRLGLHPNTLRSRLKKLGIERASHDIS